MKSYYYIESITRNEALHILHKSGCKKLLPIQEQVKYLGTFSNIPDAFTRAIRLYRNAVSCQKCCTSALKTPA